jgi:hypothetical protein
MPWKAQGVSQCGHGSLLDNQKPEQSTTGLDLIGFVGSIDTLSLTHSDIGIVEAFLTLQCQPFHARQTSALC